AELNSLEQPERPKIVIEESCHEINFFEDYYETVKWGCCGAENQLEFYDYDKKLIIEGTSTITKCRIPNSHLRFFASIDGGIRLSFSSSDQYLIQIISPPNFQDENCGPIPTDIIFESADSKDKYDQTNNEYEFWSLNGVKEKERINNLTIKVKWTCADVSEPIMIPIINGKPFGKDERVQSVSLS
ncbi:MAG: hypothetical protein HY015_00970, partial [Bacteroidetes bacterium]|nr:hypothetical protein [Bacteroidota bacterium]